MRILKTRNENTLTKYTTLYYTLCYTLNTLKLQVDLAKGFLQRAPAEISNNNRKTLPIKW